MYNEIKSVVLIGSGNVATHLGNALQAISIDIKGVWSRDERNAKTLADLLNSHLIDSLSDLPDSDLVIVSVSDLALPDVINSISVSSPVVHTSGTFDSSKYNGVFYPLQTFSKNRKVELRNVPFLIESNDKSLFASLSELAFKLTSVVYESTPLERRNLHLSAVWISNFVNHMIFKAKELCEQNDVSYKLLLPLLDETVKKAIETDPYTAQTGPARRNDTITINSHLDKLEGLNKELYSMITKSIIDTYHNEKL